MLIENRTDEQIELWKKIIKELLRRPQMPIEILSWILWINEDECKMLVDDLEYRWSIEWRVSKHFLNEAEAKNIKLVQDEIAKRLWEDKISKLTVYDLEKLLEWMLARRAELNWETESRPLLNPWNSVYIDKLLNLNNTTNDKNPEWWKKIIKEIS